MFIRAEGYDPDGLDDLWLYQCKWCKMVSVASIRDIEHGNAVTIMDNQAII
jgi:hypothetical protein